VKLLIILLLGVVVYIAWVFELGGSRINQDTEFTSVKVSQCQD